MIDLALRKRYVTLADLHRQAAQAHREATTNYERGMWFVECLELFEECERIARQIEQREASEGWL